MTNATNAFANNVYQSSIYRCNAITAGGASNQNVAQGYTNLALQYGFYRVNGISWDIQFQNLDATVAGVMWVAPAATQIVQNEAYATARQLSEMPYAVSRSVGFAEGQGGGKIKGYMSTRKIYGDKYTDTDDDFVAAFGASPASVWDLGVGWYSNIAMTAGVMLRIKLTYYCDVFGRQQQVN